MSNTKHTPGPWRCNNTLITAQDDMALRVASVYILHQEGTEYCGNAPKTVEEYKANARLIAAAPELLETLMDALAVLGDYSDVQDGVYGPKPNAAMSMATEIQRVITKVRG